MWGRLHSLAPAVLLMATGTANPASGPVRIGDRLVDLNVVAVDKNGAPVNDLTAQDFAVSDAGKTEKIVFFRREDDRALMPLQAGEYSNRSGRERHATVILFDLLNERMGTRANAWSQLDRYLGPLDDSGDLYLYMLTLDGRLFAVHGLTAAPTGEPGEAPWTRQIKPLMDRAMTDVTRLRPVDIDVAVRVQMTYAALAGLTSQLSHVPGRKNIVWITDGVPIALGPRRSDTGDYVDFTPQLRQLSELLHRFGVTIYPVRQIMLGSPDAPPDSGMGGGGFGRDDQAGASAGAGVSSDDTLDEFARMTGGRPDAGKDIAAAIRQALIDGRSSYQIGYYPASNNWDGKFHKIRITCTRKGVRLRAREGYYAWPNSPADEASKAIEDTAATISDAAGIGLRGRLSADPKDKSKALLDVRIDAGDLALPGESGQFTGHLRLAVIGYRADGRADGSPVVPLDLHYTAEDRDRAVRDGIDFSRNIGVDPDLKKLRVIVFDLGSNAIGSLTIPGQPK